MRRAMLPVLALLFLSAIPTFAADPATPVVVLPSNPTPPVVAPPAGAPVAVKANELFVFTCNVHCSVVISPKTLAKSTERKGPVTIDAVFVGGTGDRELREYPAGTFVYMVRPLATGIADLVIIPDGVTDEAKWTRLDLAINSPPPKPPDPPGPGPGPNPTPLTAVLQAAYDASTDADKAKSLKFLQATYAKMAAIPKAVKTNADAFGWIQSEVATGLNATQLQTVRKAIATDLTTTFGNEANTPIDAAAFAAELTKISNALAGVK